MTWFFILIGLFILPVLYNLLFPFKKPNLENYFTPGQVFTNEGEGLTQTILRQEAHKVFTELRLEPGSNGPPEHLHQHIDEKITVVMGTITTIINGQMKVCYAGDRLILDSGIYHRFYNESNAPVVLRAEKEDEYIPVELAYSLAQLYPLMKKRDGLSLKMIAKIAVLDELFDTVPLGPPPAIFKIMKKVVKPYARLFGFTPYDAKSKPG